MVPVGGRHDSGSSGRLYGSPPVDLDADETGDARRLAEAAPGKGEDGRRRLPRISTISAEYASEQGRKVWPEFEWLWSEPVTVSSWRQRVFFSEIGVESLNTAESSHDNIITA